MCIFNKYVKPDLTRKSSEAVFSKLLEFNIPVTINFIDGSIMFEFIYNKNYHLIEIFDDNDIVFLIRNGNTREAIDTDLKSLIGMLHEIFNSEQHQ